MGTTRTLLKADLPWGRKATKGFASEQFQGRQHNAEGAVWQSLTLMQKIKNGKYFKKNGGSITFEIDSEDIACTKDFETYPSIQHKLTTGFELPPTSLINTPELQALIRVHGTEWDYILCRVYLSKGNVIYKKLENGKYEATCSAPAPDPSS